MCYLIRSQQRAAAQPADGTPPRVSRDLRPRWVGAAAATLLGTVALAAMLAPAPLSRQGDAKPAAAAIVPDHAKVALTPVSTTGTVRSLPADDGVPASPDTAKASDGGDCHHGL